MVPDDRNGENRIHHRTIQPDEDVASTDLVQLIAEVEGCDVNELPSLWTRIDDIVDDVFSHPPQPEAQVHVQFTYAGYRIDVDQSGDVELMKVADSPAGEF